MEKENKAVEGENKTIFYLYFGGFLLLLLVYNNILNYYFSIKTLLHCPLLLNLDPYKFSIFKGFQIFHNALVKIVFLVF